MTTIYYESQLTEFQDSKALLNRSYSRWINWIKTISFCHKKYKRTILIKEHFIRHLKECLRVRNLNNLNPNFNNKMNSLINLFYIYYFSFTKKISSEIGFHKEVSEEELKNFDYYKIITEILASIKSTEITYSNHEYNLNNTILNNIFMNLLKIINFFSLKVEYSKLIERLTNFDKKSDQVFVVREDGGINCFVFEIK